MGAATGAPRIVMYLFGAAAAWLSQAAPVMAFPLTSPLNPGVVPAGGSDLGPTDVQDLQHQMALLSGFGSAGIGWTVLPRLSLQEALTDNVLQTHDQRRWDLINTVAPGIAVVGDTDRIKLRLDYQPTLQIYTRTGSENSLTHQLNAVGNVALVPDRFYVDVRGLAGVQSTYGGIGGIGTVGQAGLSPITNGGLGTTTQLGLSKQNLTQTSSFAISPYMLYRFGDAGAGRVGASLSETISNPISGFTAAPWPSGNNGQQDSTIEEYASFATGNSLSRFRDSVYADARQSHYTGLNGSSSDRESFSNRVDYAVDPRLSVYGRLGYERIDYTGGNQLNINGPTWGVGATYTPNADTMVTAGYGRNDGTTSFTFNGSYALTPRTTLTGSYNTSVSTQTELVRNQLYNASIGNNGQLVNSATGAPLYIPTNALGFAPGVYRYNTLTLGSTTVLPRDTFTLTVSHTNQTPVGAGSSGAASTVTSGGISWTHEMSPDLLVSASFYYSTGTPTAAAGENSIAAGVSAQYTLSETVSAFARYAFYQRQSSDTTLSYYQDFLIVGVTKHF